MLLSLISKKLREIYLFVSHMPLIFPVKFPTLTFSIFSPLRNANSLFSERPNQECFFCKIFERTTLYYFHLISIMTHYQTSVPRVRLSIRGALQQTEINNSISRSGKLLCLKNIGSVDKKYALKDSNIVYLLGRSSCSPPLV